MLPAIMKYYVVSPSVFPTGKKSRVEIVPAMSSRNFSPDKEYNVRIWPVEEEKALTEKEPDLVLHGDENGRLSFEWTFEREEAYYILVDNVRWPFDDYHPNILFFEVYALDEELFSLRPLRGDFHMHSSRSDGWDDPSALAVSCREEGFDFICVTDHNRLMGSLESEEFAESVPTDLKVFKGEEVHYPYLNVHILHPLASGSVTEYYVKDLAACEKEVEAIRNTLPEDMPFRDKTAMVKWVTDKIHELGDIAVFLHPFWEPNVYNVATAWAPALYKSGMFDCYELIGYQGARGNNFSVMLYNDMREEGVRLPILGDSDTHVPTGPRFGAMYTVALVKSFDREGLMEAIRSENTIPVEVIPGGERDDFKTYGPYRKASYARFLVDRYFPRVKEIAAAEGKLMREYLLTKDPSVLEALKLMKGREEKFYRSFFGLDGKNFPVNDEYAERSAKYDRIWDEYGLKTHGSPFFEEISR